MRTWPEGKMVFPFTSKALISKVVSPGPASAGTGAAGSEAAQGPAIGARSVSAVAPNNRIDLIIPKCVESREPREKTTPGKRRASKKVITKSPPASTKSVIANSIVCAA